jgi:UDP-glucose 4-epimerase
MRIVVTGASGNVGTAVLRRLVDEGSHSIVALSRRTPGGTSNESRGVRWLPMDLSTDDCLPALREALRGTDAVVHLAWAFQPTHKVDYLEQLGVGGTRRITATSIAEGIGHLVHMSSVGAYGPKHDSSPVDEHWPTSGVPSSAYSRHKASAERLLDEFEASARELVVTRLRPGIVGQRSAGSALLRYAIPFLVPAGALAAIPVMPLPDNLAIPMTHADDVADAVARVIAQRAAGPYNLAADDPVTATEIAAALGARRITVPLPVLRAMMAASWHARLQPLSPGWLDLAAAVPMLDSTRARRDLGWAPTKDAAEVFREVVAGMRHATCGGTAVLRRRTVTSELKDLYRHGPISHRRFP